MQFFRVFPFIFIFIPRKGRDGSGKDPRNNPPIKSGLINVVHFTVLDFAHG